MALCCKHSSKIWFSQFQDTTLTVPRYDSLSSKVWVTTLLHSLSSKLWLSQFQLTTEGLPFHIHFSICLWIMDPYSIAPKKNTSHGTEALPQDTMHLIQRPCCPQKSLCQDPAGNQTTQRPLDHCKKIQTEMVWTYLPFFRSGKNHLARHSERGKKTRQTEKEVGRQHQEMDRPGVCQVPEGSGEHRKMEESGCGAICGAQMTPPPPPRLRDR